MNSDISDKTKKLWITELDLLDKFEKVCKKYNLSYYADGGTLLGAVRHKGFIPWDDDIDVQMMSGDFEILCNVAEREFQEPYFFQYWRTEIGFLPWHAKLRRTDTTCYTEWEIKNRPTWNHGIFIDIFPLYGIPDNSLLFSIQVSRLKLIRFLLCCYEYGITVQPLHGRGKLNQRVRKWIWSIVTQFYSFEELGDKYLKICSIAGNKTKRVGVTSFRPGKKNLIWDRTFFEETIDLPFENRMIKCPIKYDERLRVQYGDYMIERKGSQQHSTLTFDADIPYKEYVIRK